MTFTQQVVLTLITLIVGFFLGKFFEWITGRGRAAIETGQIGDNRISNLVSKVEELFESLVRKNDQILELQEEKHLHLSEIRSVTSARDKIAEELKKTAAKLTNCLKQVKDCGCSEE